MADESSEKVSMGDFWNSSRVAWLSAGVGYVIILLTVLGVIFLEWKTIRTAVALEKGAGDCRTASADKVDPANEGMLVYLSGPATTKAGVVDSALHISAPVLALIRDPEMYIWEEEQKKSKNGEKEVVTYTYKQSWSKKKPGQSFKEANHNNPADMPFKDDRFNAGDVRLGAYSLTVEQVGKLPPSTDLPVTKEMLEMLPAELKDKARIDPEGRLFLGVDEPHDPTVPRTGDTRIRFKIVSPGPVSLVAQQKGNSFVPHKGEGGEEIDIIKPGEISRDQLFAAQQASNSFLTWLMRVGGFLLILLCAYLLLRSWVSDASGQVPTSVWENSIIGLFAPILAFPLLLMAIGIGWAIHRPMIGAGIFAVGLVFLVLLFLVMRRHQTGVLGGAFGSTVRSYSKEERAAFREVAIDPENKETRLELAALLEKNGNPLGEFIRIDLELEDSPAGSKEREKLDSRWGELLQNNTRSWMAPLRKMGLTPFFGGQMSAYMWMTHGVIDKVVIQSSDILPKRADELFRAAPGLRIIQLQASDKDYDLPGILELEQLDQIGELDCSFIRLDSEDIHAIASSPNLINLKTLDISASQLGSKVAQILARSTTLKRLEELNVRNCDLGEKGVSYLADAAIFAGLTSLTLDYNGIGPAGARALAKAKTWKRLKTLLLANNAIGPLGLQDLVETDIFPALTTLDLSYNELGADPMPKLARSPLLAHLTTLKLDNNKITSAGLRYLASSQLGKLEILALDGNEIDDPAILALAASPSIKRLVELSLSDNNISDAGLKALANWAGLANLKKLTLRNNAGTADGIVALATSRYLTKLEELDLSGNEIGIAGARALADSAMASNLKWLILNDVKLNPKSEELVRKEFEGKLIM